MKYNFKNLLFFLKKEETKVKTSGNLQSGNEVALYDTNEFPDAFFQQLASVISWTESILNKVDLCKPVDFASVLRQTNPVYNGIPFNLPSGKTITNIFEFRNYDDLLNVLFEQVILARKDYRLTFLYAHMPGKILRFEIDKTTFDGAPVVESFGFVDEGDIPPTDTWFYLTEKYLYCWIPAPFIEIMEQTIVVEICCSYEWLEDINPSLHQQTILQLNQITENAQK